MENRYDYLFNSIREFTIGLGLVLEKKALDADSLGRVTEAVKAANFCDSIKSYLLSFRLRVELKDNSLGSSFFSYSSILDCQQRAIENGILVDVLKVKSSEGWEERAVSFENSDLLFLKYDEIGYSYQFADNNNDNPVLYLYWGSGPCSSDDIVFTSYIRGAVFSELMYSLRSFPSNNEFKKINWLKFHSWFLSNDKSSRNKLITWRYEFNRFLEVNQVEKKELLGVDEFEIEFIKYIIERKEVKEGLEVFNPYSKVVTFKEYLNA